MKTEGPFILNGKPVAAISPYLDDAKALGNPHRLAENAGKSFQGSIVLGSGFVLSPEEKSIFHLRTFTAPLRVRAFRGLLAMYLCQAISMDILSAGVVYYSIYVAKASPTIFLGIFVGVQLLMFPLINSLIKSVDKRRIYHVGLPFAILTFLGVGLYPSAWPIWGIYLLTGLTAIGFAGAQVMSWIIFPDVVDAGELQLRERPTGSFSGIMTFFRKSASAIAILIFGLMLSATGYVKPTPGVSVPAQPWSAIVGIRLGMCGSFAPLCPHQRSQRQGARLPGEARGCGRRGTRALRRARRASGGALLKSPLRCCSPSQMPTRASAGLMPSVADLRR